MFKLVADQLLVAQGWVRCGHCGEVFDASLQLEPGDVAALNALTSARNTLPTPSPVHPPDGLANPIDAAAVAPSLTTPAPLNPEPAAPAQASDFGLDKADAEPVQQARQQEVENYILSALSADKPTTNALLDPQGLQDPVLTTNAYGFRLTGTKAADIQAAAPEVSPFSAKEPEAVSEVSFVRDARREAFWNKPLVRALLGLMCLLLLAALTLQWMVQKKDVLAAQEPRIAPLIQALCRPLGCEIRPLRRIESLVIDSSSFIKTGPDAYRLTFVFKNTGAAALEIPALEVTLTDSRDQALVRRVVMPAQFGATAVTLGAHSELAGAIALKVSSHAAQGDSPLTQAPLPVGGYRILAFYP